MSWLRPVLRGAGEVPYVVLSAAVGLALNVRLSPLIEGGAINVVLFALVFAVAVTLRRAEAVGVRAAAARLVAVLAITTAVLPLVAWLVARVVADGPARQGVLALGVAPAEIATVAFAAALGAGAAAGFLLLGSTVVTVVTAAPILSLLAGGGSVRAGDLLVTLVGVVLIPMALGLLAGPRTTDGSRAAAGRAATVAVIVLVGLIASTAQLDAQLVAVVLALVLFLVAGIVLGAVCRTIAPAELAPAVLLSTSMRDFAVAGGIAAASFGPAAAAPLALYGILVMVWGSAAGARWRRRAVSSPPGSDRAPSG